MHGSMIIDFISSLYESNESLSATYVCITIILMLIMACKFVLGWLNFVPKDAYTMQA